MRAPGFPVAGSPAAGRGLLHFGSVGATAHGMPKPSGRYTAALSVTRVVAGIGQAGTPVGQPFGPRRGIGAPVAGLRTSLPPLVRNGGSVVVNGMLVTSATPKTMPFGCFAASFETAALVSAVKDATGVIVTPSMKVPERTAPR